MEPCLQTTLPARYCGETVHEVGLDDCDACGIESKSFKVAAAMRDGNLWFRWDARLSQSKRDHLL
ncbi:hypothetical protein Pyn_06788 [Prunus yedoensis var. nudiflora]|uniref:Uncharacterized protein n=1 Tax=Prunus yedoensis var. nudiflora TaxID=2094558 RepID=A0A314YE91_PRUYE|nr:hypothetical protein Pyn_06788 [Prunus yedoensis var. nudiflora]